MCVCVSMHMEVRGQWSSGLFLKTGSLGVLQLNRLSCLASESQRCT